MSVPEVNPVLYFQFYSNGNTEVASCIRIDTGECFGNVENLSKDF